MKILFPIHLFYPSKIGGPANTIYWLCKALVKNGYDVSVVATKMGVDEGRVKTDEWTDVDGIKARYCNTESKFSCHVIRHSLKELVNADVVVFSSICLIQNIIIAIVSRIRGKRIIWSPRGELFDTAVESNFGKKLYFYLIRILLGRNVLFHATSEDEKSVIKSFFPHSEIVVIPNYMEVPEKEEVDTDYLNFIYVGRIAPIKAIDRLVAGLGTSKKFKNSRYIFKIVGGVENQFEGYFQELNKSVTELGLQDKVEFVGSLTGREKFQAYASARYSFLVSNSENFGNVVIEALSQGTPVVASKGTPWERLGEENAGFWIDNTAEAIARTIDHLIEQPEKEYWDFRNNALRYSKEFDIYEHIGEWEEVLSKPLDIEDAK